MRRCALFLMLAATAAGAQENEESPVFDYLFLQGGYQFSTPRADGPDANGFGIGGSLPLGHQMFFAGDYSSSRTQPFEIAGVTGRVQSTSVSFGFGGFHSLSRRADLNGSLSYISGTVRGQDGFGAIPADHADGVGIGASLRYLLTPRLEVTGGPGFSRVGGDNAWDAGAGVIVRLTRKVSLGLSASVGEDSYGLGVNLRTSVPVEAEHPADVEPRDETAPVEQTSP